MSDSSGGRPSASAQSALLSEQLDPIQVLLVDDDEDFAMLAATLLKSESEAIETRTETTPQAVLDSGELHGVDCIVSDYLMDGMDGIEFLRTVRERHPQLPFILFTGKGGEGVAQEAIAAGVSDYIVKDGSPEQYAISANRIENLVTQYRAHKQAQRRQTLDELRKQVVQTVLDAPTRDAIEQGVCEQLVETGLCSIAWIGEQDPHSGTVRPRVWAGDDRLQEIVSFSTEREPQSIEEQALDAGARRRTDFTGEEHSKWAEAAVEDGQRAAVGVPISNEGIPYGVLGVYTDRDGGFSLEEAVLIERLAKLTAFAIAASERRQGDTSRQVVDIKFDVSATDLPFVRIAELLGCRVRLTQTLTQSNGTALTRYAIAEATADDVDELESVLDAESIQLFERETDDELVVVSTEPWWAELTGIYGARIGEAVAGRRTATLRIELPPTATVRAVVDRLTDRVPGAKPISRHERTRPTRSLDEIQTLLDKRLTDRQREVIETAYHSGYFEWPHAISSKAVAELLGITQPTFAEHFWTAQRQIITLLLERDEFEPDS